MSKKVFPKIFTNKNKNKKEKKKKLKPLTTELQSSNTPKGRRNEDFSC